MHWGSPKRWCDCARTGWWIPHLPKLPGCGWAPEFAVEWCVTCLVSGSDKKLLLLLVDMLNSVWFTYTYIKYTCAYTHIPPVFLCFVTVIPYVSYRQSVCTQEDVCAIFLTVPCSPPNNIKMLSRVSSGRLKYLIRGINGYYGRTVEIPLKPLHPRRLYHFIEE